MSLIQNLEAKIDSILQSYEEKVAEINALKNKVKNLEASNKEKDLQISSLYEEIAQRDKAVESLYGKISSAFKENEIIKESKQEST
ncbi:DUF904 domain-containing protein [Helicobacter sp. MIT 01-3238]|uniref:DUF904 domain-containing protein n=1 Tax=Helicobacter sp. MIT 01-3238 TaxID=398627 RepID=UPI000E1F3C98|nr:DUF904 domain-containing protein [Helicobacter sp. MIT 01-3238]RDU55210.1 DUF904 domain-containing protein [Helicobacter sp. MIT 01-3238]